MKVSTLAALLAHDVENAIISETPDGIEAQEARGQRDFVASETLPIKCRFCTREQLERMGIAFGDAIDDLFVTVQLPDGWKKVPADDSMWSRLLDDKGRERASIFYGAAFYDRDAHISLTRRFGYSVEPVCGFGVRDYGRHEWHCVAKDCGTVVWQSEERIEPEPECPYGNESKRLELLAWDKKREALNRLGLEWLSEHYPGWEDPLAYWDM